METASTLQAQLSNLDENFKPFNENLNQTWQSVVKLWTDIGFSREQVLSRTTMIVDALNDLVNDINEGEHKLRANIEKNLIDYKQKVELLQMQLQLSLSDDELRYNATSTSGSLLDECRHYKSLYLKLLDIKKERKNRYTSLMNRQNELCSVLNERPYEFASNSPETDLDELDNLENYVHELSLTKRERTNELRQICTEMMNVLEKYQFSLSPSSSLNELFDIEQSNQSIYMGTDKMNTFRLSLDKLKSRSEQLMEDIDLLREQIKLDWSKYDLTNPDVAELVMLTDDYNQATFEKLAAESKRCHGVKMRKISTFIEKLRIRIKEIWDELCYTDEDKIDFIDLMNNNKNMDESLFCQHEAYLEELSEIYAKRIELTRKIKHWDEIWREYTQFEIEYSDPNRFKQKRYSPLVENKLRTKFTSELNKLEKEIAHECELFLRNEGDEFKLYGVTFASHVAAKKAEFERWRQECRLERQSKMETAKKQHTVAAKTPAKKLQSQNLHQHDQVAKSAGAVNIHKRPTTTASPLRARVVLGQMQINHGLVTATAMPSLSSPKRSVSSVPASTGLKRRSIKSMHDALKRRSRGHTSGSPSRDNCSSNSRPNSRPPHHLAADATTATRTHTITGTTAGVDKLARSAPLPSIHVVNPHGHIIHTYSPKTTVLKRARIEVVVDDEAHWSSSSSDEIDSALFLSNMNASQSLPPQSNSTPLN